MNKPEAIRLTLTLSPLPLRGHMALNSILWETLFLDRLHYFFLLSQNSFPHPFLKPKLMKKNSLTPKQLSYGHTTAIPTAWEITYNTNFSDAFNWKEQESSQRPTSSTSSLNLKFIMTSESRKFISTRNKWFWFENKAPPQKISSIASIDVNLGTVWAMAQFRLIFSNRTSYFLKITYSPVRDSCCQNARNSHLCWFLKTFF